ncbi:hypothetical protein KAF80_14225 [Bacillus sp. WL1]|uniref:hypothetical protein n=1 Tax=Bacillus TaxID=1386 RepID=UPI001B32E067|nr:MULTISPECIES: hypothetical protein [unclassified Bacillus (in: firmicutes)]MBP3970194.1 hypothetical protein [Bacillus sp. WL1]UOB77164.1 hypothetical protein MQW34_16995 [Bacillus sp. ZJS3]
MNINEKAIEMFEQNKYEEAMELFHRAVHESRGVQSLNNLAWMYFYEEENDDYKTMIERIKYGYVPGLEFETDFIGACYLFGCKRHNHLGYEQ